MTPETGRPHTALPWRYRPQEHDDWGFIRSPLAADGFQHVVAIARPGRLVTEEELNLHRQRKTDPYEHNGAYIVLCCNLFPDLVAALEGLADATEAEVNEKGGGGFVLARLSDARTVLLKARSAPPQQDWRPIELAPKDGTPVDLWGIRDGDGLRLANCIFDGGEWCINGGSLGPVTIENFEPTHFKAASAMTAPDTPTHAPELGQEIARQWQMLLEVDDRTSPAEYPDMALIKFEELDDAMRCAAALASPTPPVDVAALLEQVEGLAAVLEELRDAAAAFSRASDPYVEIDPEAFMETRRLLVIARANADAALNRTGGRT